MSLPIIENIAQNILDCINAITTANGFNQDLTAYRPRRTDYSDVTPVDRQVLVLSGDEEDVPAAAGTSEWIQTFLLQAIVRDSDKADPQQTIDTRINQIKSDIRKKLAEDVRRDGNAIDTQNKGAVVFTDGESFTGIEISVDVHYRTLRDDPYTKA